jgi:nicotinic acid mononucleotide adenylyltransferase
MDVSLVNRINDSGYKAFFAITGGGQSFLGDYMSISGASKLVVGAIVPYHQAIFDKFIKGAKIDSYSSEAAARRLAVCAYNECVSVEACDSDKAIGIGVTCSLAKTDERVGRKHTIFVAVHTRTRTMVMNAHLEQGRTRLEEEKIAVDLILNLLAKATLKANLGSYVSLGVTESIEYDDTAINQDVADLIEGKVNIISNVTAVHETVPIYCGSWNPWHKGHEAVYDTTKQILGVAPILELSVLNADKGQLDFIDIRTRLEGIANKQYILTHAATFVDKAKLLKREFPTQKIVFVMGNDTWERLWMPKYGFSQTSVRALLNILDIECLVFARKGQLTHIELGEHLRIKHPLAENFTQDICSTDLRKK